MIKDFLSQIVYLARNEEYESLYRIKIHTIFFFLRNTIKKSSK